MPIEVALEAQLEEEQDFEGYLRLVQELAQAWQLKMEIMEGYAQIDVCPEGTIEMSHTDGFLSITAQTSVAGPGFHAYVCDFFHAIEEKSPLPLTMIDPTHYDTHHRFDRLVKEVFHPWLKEIAQYLREIKDQDDCDHISLSWPEGYYMPKSQKGYIVTPMGYMRMEDFWTMDPVKLAERFFVWNHLGRDGAYYRNAALNLLWKECYFEYSNMDETSEKQADTIIDYLELAHRLNPQMPLPMEAYRQLCEIRQREKQIHEAKTMDFALPIGYRRDIVKLRFGRWHIPIDGYAQVNFNENTQSLYVTAPYRSLDEPWKWMAKFDVYASQAEVKEVLKEWAEIGEPIAIHHDATQGKIFIQHMEEGYLRLSGYCMDEHEVLMMEWTIGDETAGEHADRAD